MKTKMKKIEDKHIPKHNVKDKVEDDLFIERDRIITCSFEMETFNEKNKETDKKKVVMKCRVLSVCTKRHNKWFMTLDKQPWNRFMKEEDLKKFRCAIRMIVDGVFKFIFFAYYFAFFSSCQSIPASHQWSP